MKDLLSLKEGLLSDAYLILDNEPCCDLSNVENKYERIVK